MRAEGRWETMGTVLAECEEYWSSNGIPEGKVAEMRIELEGHLREALADGKTAQDVVGDDVEDFAEEWAAPNRPSRSLWEETLDVLSDTFVGLTLIAVAAHISFWSVELPVNLKGALLAVVGAMLLIRLFAFFRTPADQPSGSGETVLDRYPRRIYGIFMWTLVAVWGVTLYLPLPEISLFTWPWPATFALPVTAVLLRAAKRILPERLREAAPHSPRPRPKSRDQEQQILDAITDCALHWLKMQIPQSQVDEMSKELATHVDEAVREGKTVEDVIGPNLETFAEDWAEGYGAEPDPSPEPLRHRLQGWVLSVSASAALLAIFVHIFAWTLYVPVAWIVGMYSTWLAIWFLGDPVLNLLDKSRYTGWKSMLSAATVVLGGIGFAVVMAFFFMNIGPMIPFQWPWYATIISAVVASLVVYGWLKEA